MGKSGGGRSAQSQETEFSRQQAEIAQKIFEETTGLRTGLIGSFEERLGLPSTQEGPLADASLFGPTAPERETLESQFTNARENILSRTPTRGGQLNETLADLETDRARAVTGLDVAASREALALGQGVAFGAPAQAISGLGGAASQFGVAATRGAQASAAAGQGAGSLVGTLGSAGLLSAALKK